MRTLGKATMFAIQSTVHTITQHTPSRLIFGGDTILNINQEADRHLITSISSS